MRVPQFDISKVTKVGGMGSPYQTARAATPDTFGAAKGEKAERSGVRLEQDSKQMLRVAIDIQQKDNQTEAKKLDAEAMRRIRIESYGGQLDPNDPASQKTGYYNSKNDETLAATGNFQGAMKKHYDEVLAKASNDSVKRMLSKSFIAGYEKNYNASAKFHISQKNNAQKIHSAARLMEAQQSGILGDEKIFNGASAIVQSEVVGSLKQQGITDPATIASGVQAQISQMVVGRIERLIGEQDFQGAEDFAKRMVKSGKLDELKAGTVLKQLRSGAMAQKAFNAVDAVVGNGNQNILTADGLLDTKKLTTAYEKLKTLPGDVRKAAVAALDKVRNRIVASEKMAISDSMEKAVKAMSDGMSLSEWMSGNAALVKPLFTDPRYIRNLQSFENSRLKGIMYAPQPTGTGAKVMELTPAVLAKATVVGNTLKVNDEAIPSNKFTKEEWNKIPTTIRSAKNKMQINASKDAAYNTGRKALLSIAPKNVRVGSKKYANNTKQKEYKDALKMVDDWITEQQQSHPQKQWPTLPEISKFLRNQYIGAYVDDGLSPLSATDIGSVENPTPGALLNYRKFDEEQKNAVEVDWEQYKKNNPDGGTETVRLVEDAAASNTLTQKAKNYIEENGIERFYAHIIALRMVNDLDRGRSYFVTGTGD